MSEKSPKFEFFNGQLVETDTPIFTSFNRAFRYGDGVFETMKVTDNTIQFFEDHFERLTHSMEVLKLGFTEAIDREKLHHLIMDLLKKNEMTSARVRLTLFRDGTGFYLPINNSASLHISCSQINTSVKKTGLNLGLFEDVLKAPGSFSNLKTLNALPYILASLHAAEHNFDDVFILNTSHKIIESANSNLFVIYDTAIFTPPLSDGCLNGVMRKNIIRKAHEKGVLIYERSLDVLDVIGADEILLTNAIKGVQWVQTFNHKTYSSGHAQEIRSWF